MNLVRTKNSLCLHSIFIFFSLILMSASCEKQKETAKNENEKLYELSGQFLIHQPHCGGRAPNPEKVKQEHPYKNKMFVVKKGLINQDDTTVVATFTTEKEGKFSIQLPEGTYCIIRAEKNQPYADFYAEYKKPYDRFYSVRDESCFQDWWKKGEITIALKADAIIPPTKLFNKCFVGENPCMNYNGPMPP